MEINKDFYDFLKENETGLFEDEDRLIAFVHVPYYKLEDFVEIIGDYHFDEGGMKVELHRDTVCVDINDFIEHEGHSLLSYKDCFDESEISRYEYDLLAFS